MAETISRTYCAYSWMDGQAELAWVAGYTQRWFAHREMVTHPSNNQSRVTLLLRPMALPLHQTATKIVLEQE